MRRMKRTDNTGRKLSSRKWITATTLVLVMLLLAVPATFAWFRNILEVNAIHGQTGKFEYQFIGFTNSHLDDSGNPVLTKDFAYSTQVQDGFIQLTTDEKQTVDGSLSSGGDMASDGVSTLKVAELEKLKLNTKNYGEFYFVVRKLPGSVDLDVSISLNAQLEKLKEVTALNTTEDGETSSEAQPENLAAINGAVENIGGFWYTVEKVSGTVVTTEGLEASTIDGWKTYLGQVHTQEPADGLKNFYFPNIRKEYRDHRLAAEDYMYIRVCYGLNPNAVDFKYTDKSINIFASVCVAQVGGLENNEIKLQHPCYTKEDLAAALLNYRPYEEIIIAAPIEYYGNVILDRPGTLTLQADLTVYGNVEYSYVGAGIFDLNTRAGGTLYVKKMQDAEAGGNFDIHLPRAQLNIAGLGLPGAGEADIYVEQLFSVNASYKPPRQENDTEGENGNPTVDDESDDDRGLILSSVRICALTAEGEEEKAKDIQLRGETKLVVNGSSVIGRLTAEYGVNSSLHTARVRIVNYGTIGGIDLSKMIQKVDQDMPLIYIRNHGVIQPLGNNGTYDYHIALNSWAKKYHPETHPDGNTRIIYEDGASIMKIYCHKNSFKGDGSGNSTTDDVEYVTKDVLIEKVGGDKQHIIIHYLPANGRLNGLESTIENIVEYYAAFEDGNVNQIAAPDQLLSVRVVCSVAQELRMTEKDYEYIRDNMKALVSLDLGEAFYSTNNILPDNAFYGMSELSDLILPPMDTRWGNAPFSGTKVDEITLPTALQHLSNNSLEGIKYLHLRTKADILIHDCPTMFQRLAETAIDDSPYITLIADNEQTRALLVEAVEKAYAASTGKTEEYHFKDKDGLIVGSELKKISRIFVSTNAQRIGNYLVSLHTGSGTCTIHTYIGDSFSAADEKEYYTLDGVQYQFDFKTFKIGQDTYHIYSYDDFAFMNTSVAGAVEAGAPFVFGESLRNIGDGAFYSASLPENVDLGGATYVGHAALANNGQIKNLAGLSVETVGFYACGGYNISFFNMPRLSTAYGNISSYTTRRIDIGLVEMASDAVPKVNAEFSQLFGNSNSIWNTTVVIHTAHITTAPDAIVRLGGNNQGVYKVFAPAEYADRIKTAGYCGNILSLYTYDASTIGFLNFDGTDVTDDKFSPGDYAFTLNSTGTAYELRKCINAAAIDGFTNGVEGVLTIPAYYGEGNLKSTSISGGAFHYHDIKNVKTLTFAEEYESLATNAFRNSDNTGLQENKCIAHIDFNQIKTIPANAFKNFPSLRSVSGKFVTSVGKQAFAGCEQLCSVALPNAKLEGGWTAETFKGCRNLTTVALGPQYNVGNVFVGCTGLETIYLNLTNFDATQNQEGVYWSSTDGNGVVSSNLNVIAIGHPFTWDKTPNSPLISNDSSAYKIVNLDCTIDQILFADWKTTKTTSFTLGDATRTFTFELNEPTYILSQSGDGLKIELAMGLQDITVGSDGVVTKNVIESVDEITVDRPVYIVPKELYQKVDEPKVNTILGNETTRYYTVQTDELRSAGKGGVVAIGDNVYRNKISDVGIEFPIGMISIGENTFADCEFLGELVIDGNATEGKHLQIGNNAFAKSQMTAIEITNVATIGDSAFADVKYKYDNNGTTITKALTHVNLGDKLTNIGTSAFAGAMLNSVTTTHQSTQQLALVIGQKAFDGVTNDQVDGVSKPINVDLGGAVVTFETLCFNAVKLDNLTAPYTALIEHRAFHYADITGVADFSKGVPNNGIALDVQTIKPGAFYTDADKPRTIGEIHIGKNAVIDGNGTEQGVFLNYTIGKLVFPETAAVSPKEYAFVGCTFETIELGGMKTIAYDIDKNEGWIPFYNCTKLGNVNFANVTTIGSLVNASATINPVNLFGTEGTIPVNFKEGAFRYLTIGILDEEQPYTLNIITGSTVGQAAFNQTIINGNLVLGEDLVLPGDADAHINRAEFYNCVVKGTTTVGNRVNIGIGSLQKSTFEGPVTINSNVKFDCYSLLNAKFNGPVTVGSDVTIRSRAFQEATFNDSVSIGSDATLGSQAFHETYFYGNLTIDSYQTGKGSSEFFGSQFGRKDALIDITFGKDVVWGTNAFNAVKPMYANLYFADGFTFSSNKPFYNNITIHGTVSIGEFYSTQEASLFQIPNYIGKGRVNRVEFRETCTEIPRYLLGNANFGTVDFSRTNGVTLGDYAFVSAQIDQIIGMDRVTSIGDNAFAWTTYKGKAQRVASVTTGMNLSNVTSIGSNAFNGFTFKQPINIEKATTIGNSAFANATIQNVDGLTIADGASLGDTAFQLANISGKLDLGDGASLGNAAFGSATLGGEVTVGSNATLGGDAFANAVIPGKLDIQANVAVGTSAFANAQVTGDTTLGVGARIGENAFANAVLNGNLALNNGSRLYKTPFCSATINGNVTIPEELSEVVVTVDETTGASTESTTLGYKLTDGAFMQAKIGGEVNIYGNLTIGTQAFVGDISVVSNEAWTVLNPVAYPISKVIFHGNPTIEAEAFRARKIGELTFEQGGTIGDDAFADGDHGVINLGSVASIGAGTLHPENTETTPTTPARQGGAFAHCTIGTINFENACLSSDEKTQTIGNNAFDSSVIGFLNFGSKTEGVQPATRYLITGTSDKWGSYSPFHNTEITRLNLNGVAEVGKDCFAMLTIGGIDPIENDITLGDYSFRGTTINGDLIFEKNLTYGIAFYHYAGSGNSTINIVSKISGSMRVLGTLKGTSTDNIRLLIDGDLYINKIDPVSKRLLGYNAHSDYHNVVGGKFTVAGGTIPKGVFMNIRFNGEVDLRGVTALGSNAFDACRFNGTSVLQMPNVTSVGDQAFWRAVFKDNTALYLDKAESIGKSAFARGDVNKKPQGGNLAHLYIPKAKTIGDNAFLDNYELRTLDLPSIERLGATPFAGCTALKSVVIGGALQTWGTGAFEGVNSELEKVILRHANPGNIQGTLALPARAKLAVPHHQLTQYEALLTNTPNLWAKKVETTGENGTVTTTYENLIVFANHITHIELLLQDAAGNNYLALPLGSGTEVELVGILANTVALRSADYVFQSKLTDTISGSPYTVVSIDSEAMRDLNEGNITTITLPASLKYVNFSGQDVPLTLTQYAIEDGNTSFMVDAGAVYTKAAYGTKGDTLVLYPVASAQNAEGEKITEVTISGIKYIGERAFAHNLDLTKITFTGSEIIVMNGAFEDCHQLAQISFADSSVNVRFIGRDTVAGCDSLTSITLGQGGTSEALYDTDVLRKIPAQQPQQPAA